MKIHSFGKNLPSMTHAKHMCVLCYKYMILHYLYSTATVAKLDERYILVPQQVKDTYVVSLCDRLHSQEEKTIILFTHSCRSVGLFSLLVDEIYLRCLLEIPQEVGSKYNTVK